MPAVGFGVGIIGGHFARLWNAVEEHGDYKKIAHIDRDRKVTFYDKKLPTNIKENIITEACTNNTNISATQDQKIFSSPPAKYKKEE